MANLSLQPADIERLIRSAFLQEHPELRETEFSIELCSAEYSGAIPYMRCAINWIEEEPEIDTIPLIKTRLTARDYERAVKPISP